MFGKGILASLALALGLTLAQPAAADGEIIGNGTFIGASGHTASGGGAIITTGKEVDVVLAQDFSFDGAPDPRVGLGKGGTYDPKTDAGKLRTNKGGQVYKLPAGLDVSQYDEIYIWCEQYSVPLATAKLR